MDHTTIYRWVQYDAPELEERCRPPLKTTSDSWRGDETEVSVKSKYLNNLAEQDHRFIKRLVKPGLGFFSFKTAWRTLQGHEAINMMGKGQMQGVSKGDNLRQAAFIAELFGMAF